MLLQQTNCSIPTGSWQQIPKQLYNSFWWLLSDCVLLGCTFQHIVWLSVLWNQMWAERGNTFQEAEKATQADDSMIFSFFYICTSKEYDIEEGVGRRYRICRRLSHLHLQSVTDTIDTAGFTEVPMRVFGLVNIMQGVPRAEVAFLCSSLPLRISAQMDGSAKPNKPFVSGSSRNTK